jgi:hypothetical protein
MNSYPMLTFTGNVTFKLDVIEMPTVINDARQAVFYSFGVTEPIELLVERPRGLAALKRLLEQLKPTNLFNPEYIPHSVLIPGRNDSKVCLCLKPTDEILRVGLVLENRRLVMASLKKTNDAIASITDFVADVCRYYFCGEKPVSQDVRDALSILLADAEAEYLGSQST